MTNRSVAASLALWTAVVSAGLMLLGVSAIHVGLLRPIQGFTAFLVSLLAALVALGVGLLGLWRTRRSAGRSGRTRAWAGVVYGAVVLGAIGFLLGAARGLPAINDITTDTTHPPVFVAAKKLASNVGHDMSYPASFAAMQKKAYPFVQPLHLDVPPRVAFDRAEAAIQTLGFHTESSDPATGRIEATDTSTVFQFVDDIVVRVTQDAGGSVVDIRSRSRDGKGDLGVNADRIRRLGALIEKPAADGER
jgi:uncharacterized protein (DUF1499 family)